MINILDYFFVLLIVILGVVVAAEDLFYGKIRNKWIAIGLSIGSVLYLLLFLGSVGEYFGVFGGNYSFYSLSYLLNIFINFSISLLVGYLFWQYKLWSAGDAKFFMLLSFLLPIRFYSSGYLPYFPSSALLVNIFTPIFLFLIIKMILSIPLNFKKFFKKEVDLFENFLVKIRTELNSFLKYKKRIFVIIGTFFLTFIVVPVIKSQTILIFSANFIAVLAIFLLFYFLQKYFSGLLDKISRNNFIFAIIILLSIIYFILGFIYFNELFVFAFLITIKVGFIFLIGLAIFNGMSNFYLAQKEIVVVDVQDLKAGMIISDELVQNIENDKQLQIELGDLYAEGLTRDQAEILREWFLKNNNTDIPVYKTFSFAPYIFAGAIITIILKQSILHLILNYF